MFQLPETLLTCDFFDISDEVVDLGLLRDNLFIEGLSLTGSYGSKKRLVLLLVVEDESVAVKDGPAAGVVGRL